MPSKQWTKRIKRRGTSIAINEDANSNEGASNYQSQLQSTPCTLFATLSVSTPSSCAIMDSPISTYSRSGPNIRKRQLDISTSIYPILPRAQELFALYLLTRHFPGDPDHLKKVGEHQCETFLESARLRGLIKDSDVWIRTLQEGANYLTPAQMRQLFASILIFGNTENCVLDGSMLWNRFLPHMYDSRCRETEKARRIDLALALLEQLLVRQGKQCSDFGLPTPLNSIVNDPHRGVNDFFFPENIADDERDESVDTSAFERAKLNDEQQSFFNRIRDVAATMPNNSSKRLFFLSGDGGTGKTFLLKLCALPNAKIA
ncbi:hypothetical protein niasHT_014930 [Heterodera trifolii]|uniref:DNA helicase n=1 Tax=Heterodera trifolii TaxID=157864 RepID=A0ABD2LGK3_9BILA